MELRRAIDPAAHGPDKRVWLAHPAKEGYAVYPCEGGYRVTLRGAEVGIYPDATAARSAAFQHRWESRPGGPRDPAAPPSLFDGPPAPPKARPKSAAPATGGDVPAGWEPPSFVPAEDAWMYPGDETEGKRC